LSEVAAKNVVNGGPVGAYRGIIVAGACLIFMIGGGAWSRPPQHLCLPPAPLRRSTPSHLVNSIHSAPFAALLRIPTALLIILSIVRDALSPDRGAAIHVL
jgi:hypothetical protein